MASHHRARVLMWLMVTAFLVCVARTCCANTIQYSLRWPTGVVELLGVKRANGVPYSLGNAYVITPDVGTFLQQIYAELGMDAAASSSCLITLSGPFKTPVRHESRHSCTNRFPTIMLTGPPMPSSRPLALEGKTAGPPILIQRAALPRQFDGCLVLTSIGPTQERAARSPHWSP